MKPQLEKTDSKRMQISKFIEDVLKLAIVLEDRASGQRLHRLATDLRLLYFQPQNTTPLLEELISYGRLTTTTRSAALAQLDYSAPDINGIIRDIEDILRDHGHQLLSPSQYASVSELVRSKRALRLKISDELDELIKLPARFKTGAEPYAEIKDRAREIRDQIDNTNQLIDDAHAEFTSADNKITQPKRPRFPQSVRYFVIALLLVAIAYALFFFFGRIVASVLLEIAGQFK